MTKQTKSTFYSTLTSPYFLLSLTLLVLNDHLFKYQFHNFLTGKISDFAGVFCFGLFFAGLFPKHAKGVLFAVGLFFFYWKSEFSTPFIHWFNQHTIFNYSRVVDYGDLSSLVMLPLAYFKLQDIVNAPTAIRMSPVLPLLLTSVSFVATSQEEVPINCYAGTGYDLPITQEELIRRIENNFYTDDRGFELGSDETLLEYRTGICGDTIRVLVPVRTAFITDSTSAIIAFDICLECEDFIDLGDVLDDFEERVVDVLRSN
ncbi:MAG: hypothetical protein R8G66_20550 [Cytophagales bacterium]|nr:hypothetical protein [Cytophagales bacterium]